MIRTVDTGVERVRPVSEVLSWSRRLSTPPLREAVDTLPASMRRIAGYHFGWWDASGRAGAADSGKAIRPALALLAAEAAGGEATAALPAAVAVELVHNFSLVHDDVIDGDHSRRHRAAAWTVFGSGSAIVAGDALLTLAFDVLSSSRHPAARSGARILTTAILELAEGQHADLAFEQRTNVDLPECLRMAERKCGALLGCACALGATFAGGATAEVLRLRRFGERLGLAFQLVDDLLGIWGDPAVTGKPVYSDLRRRKKSIPLVAALTSETEAGEELAALYHRERPLSGAELRRAAHLVDRSGARAWCRTRAAELLSDALRHLYAAAGAGRAAAELAALARQAVHRDH